MLAEMKRLVSEKILLPVEYLSTRHPQTKN
jgi:hypothetical protein